jgi:hypothetical protein
MHEHFYDVTEPLHYTELKAKIEAMGFVQDKCFNDRFHRVKKYPWWKRFWFHRSELVILGHLVWFYEKTEADLDSNASFKCWGRSNASFNELLESL